MEKPTFFIITSPSISDTGRRSYGFIFVSGAPRQASSGECGKRFDYVYLRDRDVNEVDPFKFVRGEPGAVGPDGIKKWGIEIFGAQGVELTGSVNEDVSNEAGLQELIVQAPSATLLMVRDIFDRFKLACDALGIGVVVHHFCNPLATS